MSCAEVAPSGVNEAMTSVVNDLTREVVKELTRLHIPPRWTKGTDYGYSPSALKNERVHRTVYATGGQAPRDVIVYSEGFYNHRRN
jgi:hypothetical protein